MKSLKAKGLWYRALVPWGRREGPGHILFPGEFALLGLRAVSPGLCPDSVSPDRAQEIAQPKESVCPNWSHLGLGSQGYPGVKMF